MLENKVTKEMISEYVSTWGDKLTEDEKFKLYTGHYMKSDKKESNDT